MPGLDKPLTQRGSASSRRNATSIATPFGNNGSIFVSKYQDDKYQKWNHDKHFKKWIIYVMISVGVVLGAKFITSKSSSSSWSWSSKPGEMSTKIKAAMKNSISAKTSAGVEKGLKNVICQRLIPFDLSDTSSWPTPHKQLLDNPANTKEVVLLQSDGVYGGIGEQFNSFFHAYDMAYDSKTPLAITTDSWVWDTLFPMFLGYRFLLRGDKLDFLGSLLNAKIVASQAELESSGVKALRAAPNGLFYIRSKNLSPEQVRDHRNTMLRKLFQYPARNSKDVCSAIETLVGKTPESIKTAKYTVLHVSPTSVKTWLPKLNEVSNRDHAAALDMAPEYVKSILDPLGMLRHDVIVMESGAEANTEVSQRLFRDADLATSLKKVPESVKDLGSYVYLAVLSDVFLGNPVDMLCLWIARMRCALGMKNTFVLTEKKSVDGKDQWVSYLDSANCLELYDGQTLGPWMG